jgi:hypothetical protein
VLIDERFQEGWDLKLPREQLGELLRRVARPSYLSVERHDPNWIRELSVQ